jgi:hypothetical protein
VLYPFESGTFALRMGVRPLDLRQWLADDRTTLGAELALKRDLLATRADDVVAVDDRPRTSAVCAELDELVADWWVGRDRPPPEPDATLPPIVRASLRTREDWCVLDGTKDGTPVLVAGCVCFPTRWILAEKIGRPMGVIHQPVAFYDEQLGAPVDRFLSRLRVEAPVWRANWNLVDDGELCQAYLPEPGRRLECRPSNVADLVHLRVERQTLRRLPVTGAIAFGIGVDQQPLRALEAEPEVLGRLLEAIRALPAQTFAYKGLAAFWPELEAWLTSRVTGADR